MVHLIGNACPLIITSVYNDPTSDVLISSYRCSNTLRAYSVAPTDKAVVKLCCPKQ